MNPTLEHLAAEHSAAGDALAALVREVEAAALAAYDERRAQIDAAAKRVAATEDSLRNAVGQNAALFDSPRSARHAGIEFGMAKAPDRPMTNPETADLIREHFPDLVPVLLRTAVARGELKHLPAKTRRRIHVRIVPGADAPFVRRVRDDLAETWPLWRAMVERNS